MMLTSSCYDDSPSMGGNNKDDEMIDGLFYACDQDNEGRVAVTSLINYLASNTNHSTDSDGDEALQSLKKILNPEDAGEKQVDLDTCRSGIRQWIKDLRNGSDSSSLEDVLNSPGRNSPRRKMLNDSFRQYSSEKMFIASPLLDSLDLSRMSLDNSVLETSNRIQEQEICDMLGKITDLQHQNKKLVEDNSKLQQQLDVQEENVATLSLGNKNLQKKLKSLQQIVEERNQVLVENEDLKSALSTSIDTKKRLEDQIMQLEKDYQVLQKEMADSDNKVHQMLTDLEKYKNQISELNSTLSELKIVNQKIQEINGVQETHLLEKVKKLEELESYIDKLHKMNEDIRADKSDLQQELIQAQNHIYSLHNGKIKTEQADSALVDSEASISLPLEGEITPPSCSLPTSTPLRTSSIHTELKNILTGSLHLPSPLCNKELTESMLSLDDQSIDDLSEDLETYSEKNIIREANSMISRCKEKREDFLHEMEDLLNTPSELDKYRGNNSFMTTDPDSFNKTDKRNQVMEVIKKLKAENERLRTLHDQAVDTLINSEKDIDTSFDNRLIVLRDTLTEERKLRRHVELEIRSVKKMSSENLKELESTSLQLQSLKLVKDDLEKQNEKLERSNLDLAEKCHKAEIKTSELRGDLHQSEIAREREKKRCTDIEETLSKSRLTRQLELREIWRLVQKEIETEGLDDPRDSPVSASTDCLKDHITKEIENLKDRLNKRQTALGVLKGKQLQLPLNRVHQDGGDTVCYQLQDSPSSPLVDALTIDFFNGNVVKSGIRPPTFSSFDAASLQRINCEACMKHVALSSNTSCPSLHQNIGGEANRYVASTSNLNASRISHPNLNTSSSSSTSGVDVSPRRTRSIHGQIKRRSFIRHSSRYKNDDTSTRSDTEISNMQTYPHEIQPIERFVMDELNVDSPSAFRRSSYTLAIENQSAELNEDNLQPIARDRSLSFQAAIEHGQRSPDSAMELTQSCERSTSDTSDYQEYRYDSFIGQTSRNDGRTEGKSVSFDMGSEQDYEEEVENPAESLIRSNDSPHRKLSILREEEGENHSDQNGNINKSSEIHRLSTNSNPVDEEGGTMDNFHGNVVRKSNHVKHDNRQHEPIPVGLTRDDLLAHIKNTSNNHTIPGSFPPKLHSPTSVKNINNNEENIKDATSIKDGVGAIENKEEEERAHIVKLEEECDNISTVPQILTSRLSKLRQTNLAKKREQMKTMKLPELPEQGEISNQSRYSINLPDDFDKSLTPPPPSDDDISPSIPDSFLEKLGLKVGKDNTDPTSADNLPEKEVENKFNALSLAFRTDRLTLDKRLEIQERARDISEQNVDQELHGLREAVETLNRLCSDTQIREVITKIRNHIDVLEQCAARVSSRAEVLGAVQQERRMCRAMEVMIVHVDNQKRLYEKDHSELEEARKVLQDRPFGSLYGDAPTETRRSMSVCVANGGPRQRNNKMTTLHVTASSKLSDKLRRRSDVALPRVLGGRGCPPLLHSSSLDHSIFEKKIGQFKDSSSLTSSHSNDDEEDPKQRFQSAVASTSMKNAVTTVIRRASLERLSSLSPNRTSSRENLTEIQKEKEEPRSLRPNLIAAKKSSQEEEAYQKGFEDGVKMKISKDLGKLREQQNGVSSSLEEIMDKVEQVKQEEEEDIKNSDQLRQALMTKIKMFIPNKKEFGQRIRYTLAGLIFAFAVLTAIVTLMPSNVSAVEIVTDVRHHAVPPL